MFSDGDVDNITFNGIVDSAGNIVSGSFNSTFEDGTSAGTFSGSISGGTWNFSAEGSDTSGVPLCEFDVDGTLTLIGGADILVDPAITPSSTLTTPLLLNTFVITITSNLSTRIGDALRGTALGIQRTASGFLFNSGPVGLNAGDGNVPKGGWVSYSYADYDNDLSSTAFDGRTHSVLAGFDFAPWEPTVFGIAVGYENSDVDTTFNRGNQESDGYTIAPYFGGLLSDTWSVDFAFGYSNIDSDQFRIAPGTTTRITSSPDADRWFGAFNLNGVTYWDNWIIGGRIGTLWAKHTIEAFVESNGTVVAESKSKLGQWSIGGDAAYSYGEWEPFVRATYERDYSLTTIAVTTGPQPSNDRDDVLFGVGLRYFRANGWTGNLEYNKRLDREDLTRIVLMRRYATSGNELIHQPQH